MKLMLTSFGIDSNSTPDRTSSVFDSMPPVSFRSINQSFRPDYELLLLCDQVVMDERSFHKLTESPARAYLDVADTFRALNSEGRIELVDFSSILNSNADLLHKMLDYDLKILDQWVIPLRESLTTWRDFANRSMELWRDARDEERSLAANDHISSLHVERSRNAVLMHEMAHLMHSAKNTAYSLSYMVEEALESSEKRKRKEYRGPLREVLQAYLSYVNANLVLSSELDIAFHDWLDFTPFYAAKFLSVGKKKPEAQERREQVGSLFTLAFPDLAVKDTSALLKVLNDKRIQELRQLIVDAAAGRVVFDEHFANSVLTDVLRSERKAGRVRRVLGYLTLPVGLIPWIGTPAQKIIEEAVGTPIERKIKQKHQWFYMLSDISDSKDSPIKHG